MAAAPHFPIPQWRRAHPYAGESAALRSRPGDFRVTEVCNFQPSGSGEHDLLYVEKTASNTTWVARQLARFAAIPPRDVGFAGMKDRHAVTRQWFSVRRASGSEADWSAFEHDGIRIIESSRHSRKLRRGAHAGNRFRIRLRAVSETQQVLDARLQRITEHGVPNYFGEQRFGHDGSNLKLASDYFSGVRVPRARRGIALSCARAWLFNHVLERRVADGSWDRLVPGDCASLEGSNSFFEVSSVDTELARRCQTMDVHPSGPLWGQGAPGSSDQAARLEQEVADRFPEFRDGLEKHTKLARRALRLAVQDLAWQRDGDALDLEFYLVRGGYATAVLREVTSYAVLSRPRPQAGTGRS
jgi:tRNA pseudouridine13 synthase